MGIFLNLDSYNSLPYIIDIKDKVKETLSICEKLASKDNEDYIIKTISNSDESGIEVLIYPKSKAETYKIKVLKLACCQENLGSRLYSEELSMLDEGDYSFTVAKGEKTRTITVRVEEEDTNNKILIKILKALDREDLGIEGYIENYNRYIDKLLLKSKDKGTANQFRIFDKRGNLVAYTGMWNEFIEAEDSVAIVNNREYKSSSDIFEMDDGEFSFRVKKVSKVESIVKITWNIDLIVKSIFQLIERLNSLLEEFKREEMYQNVLNILLTRLHEIENIASPLGVILGKDLKVIIMESKLKDYLDKNSMYIDKAIRKAPNIFNGIMEFFRSILNDKIILGELEPEKTKGKSKLDRGYNGKGNLIYKDHTIGRNYDDFS